jgi:hypothetical protein
MSFISVQVTFTWWMKSSLDEELSARFFAAVMNDPLLKGESKAEGMTDVVF